MSNAEPCNLSPLVDLGRGLEWALYWIGRCAEVPLHEDEQDEWERWAEASRALRTWGPESGYAADAYQRHYRRDDSQPVALPKRQRRTA